MLLLTEKDIRSVFTMENAIESNLIAYREFSAGRTVVPLRLVLPAEGDKGNFAFMPAYSSGLGAASVKIVNIFPGNAASGIPSTQGQVLLMDGETGSFRAIMDGTFITAFRTGAASGAAFKLFARKDARVGALIGTGGQAACQLEAMLAACDLEEVRISARNFEKTVKFAEEMQQAYPAVKMVPVHTGDEAIMGADVIIVVTVATEPTFDAANIKKGAVISGVGSYTPEMNELDPKLFALADKIYFDSQEACLAESGDVQIPLKEGLVKESDFTGEIGEVILGEKPGRESDDEIIVFKNVGIGVLDLVVADQIYGKAKDAAAGVNWE